MSIQYYFIRDLKLVGKMEDHIPYLYYKNLGWEVDKAHIIWDRLIGYDESEPDDSPYKIGNTDMLSRLEAISKEQAKYFISEDTHHLE